MTDVESDDESVMTDDIQEIEVVLQEPEIEPEIKPETLKKSEDVEVKTKKKGRPKKAPPPEGMRNVSNYSKDDLMDLLEHQYKKNKLLEDEKLLKLIETNKKVKTKKERTPAQIAATAKLLEANRIRREKKKSDIKQEIKQEMDEDISTQVQEELVKIIQKPLRSLTPDRIKKVEEYTQKTTRKSRF